MSFDCYADTAPLTAVAAAHAAAPAAAPGCLVSHGLSSPRRALIEQFVRREFFAHFGARIRHFMPELLGLHEPDGTIRAAVGCRSAAEPLFLETYTGGPIELAIESACASRVPREQIVEIGSLACRNATAAVAIVRALVPYLLQSGFSWVVFTGADTVMNVFRHLGLAPRALCPADPLLLGDARFDWGTYYDHEPRVMAGRIADGVAATQRRALPRAQ
jgi:hypothetical protein